MCDWRAGTKALLVLLLLLTAAGQIVETGTAGGDGGVSSSFNISLAAGQYTITKDSQGYDVISLDGFTSSGSPGNPLLPYRVYNILLPPDVIPESIVVTAVNLSSIEIKGSYNIRPVPSPVRVGASQGTDSSGWGKGVDIVDGKSMDVYGSDVSFPQAPFQQLPYSQMRKWKFTRIAYTPFQYNPVSGSLTYTSDMTLRISYRTSGIVDTALLRDTCMQDLAPQMFYNYAAASGAYLQAKALAAAPKPLGTTYDFVIITTSDIQDNSTRLSAYVAHRQSKGHNVKVVNEKEWGSLTGQPPNGNAEKIRKWLQNNYSSMGIKYVLMIGHSYPDYAESTQGDIPMKLVWPEVNHPEWGWYAVPTDYYYADLTGNWNLDGDQYFGEYYDDTRTGGVDLVPEVYVGRIPVYRTGTWPGVTDYASLDLILQKIMDYENEADTAWRKSALMPMSFLASNHDLAPFAEQMKADFLSAKGYSSYTMYQQGHGACGWDSAYNSDEELRGGTGVRDRWAANDYGLVVWAGHGSTDQVEVGASIFGCGDGYFFETSYCSALDDEHPAFTYQGSCNTGDITDSENLQYSLLKHGAVATVGATLDSWGDPFQDVYGKFDESATCYGIGYQYVKRLVAGSDAGTALWAGKASIRNYVNSYEWFWNFYDFNLYGDPTTSLSVQGGTTTPPAPVLTSPADGAAVSDTSITFKWNASSGATKYWLTVQKVNDGSYICNREVGNATSYAVSGFPNDGTRYRWTVKAGNSVGWGTPAAWRTFINGKPAAPALVSPANGATVSGTSITFKWKSSPGATKYWLIVQKISDDSYTCNQEVGNATSYAVSDFPDDGTRYRWTVKAGNSTGWGTEAAWRTFINGKPAAPALVSPANGATVRGTPITFKWNASSGATNYWLTVQKVSDGSYLCNKAVGKFTSYSVSGFPNSSAEYRWTVKAGNSTGWGTEAAWRTFTTAPRKPAVPSLVYPADDAIRPAQPLDTTAGGL